MEKRRTANSTNLVRDIRPGPEGADLYREISLNGGLYFFANDGIHGVELWKTDGTTAGTIMLNDGVSGIEGTYPRSLANVNGVLFFNTFENQL